MEGIPHTRVEPHTSASLEYGPKTLKQRLRLRHVLAGLGIGLATMAIEDKYNSDTADAESDPDTVVSHTDESTSASSDSDGAAHERGYTMSPPVVYPHAAEAMTGATVEDQSESNESVPISRHFDAYTQAAAAAYTMRRDQVVLTDRWGHMLTDGPVDLYDAAGYTPAEMTWRYQDGEAVGIPGILINELKERQSAVSGVPVDEIALRHAYLGMKKDEFKDYDSLQAAALHNALQKVPDDPAGRTFLEVIEDEFYAPIPGPDGAELSGLLKEYVPALISKESLFNINAVSSAGALGAMQFMPQTWQQYAPEGAEPTSFVEAVKAAGAYFAASYEYLYKNNRDQLDVIESEFFSSDHTAFVQDFVLPCLINGYNAGDGTMRDALEHFTRTHGTQAALQAFYNTTEPVGGKDVFFAFTQIESGNESVPNYGPYAGEYTLEIAARKQAGTRLSVGDRYLAQVTE